MKIKSLLCAAVMAVSCVVLPSTAQAETTYASPSELITDAIEVALSGVESSTYDTAIANMQSLITVSGNDVSYDGSVIGYWDSTTSDVLYKDSSMTEKVLYADGDNIWRFEPTLLAEILEDVNNDLIETIVPTTEDWSKIIGKYDVTLGGVTIPASQWVNLKDKLEGGIANSINLSKLTGLDGSNMTGTYTDNTIYTTGYVIKDGKLYITNALANISLSTKPYWAYSLLHMDGTRDSERQFPSGIGISTANCSDVRAFVSIYNSQILSPKILVANSTCTTASDPVEIRGGYTVHGYNVMNCMEQMSGSVQDASQAGILYFTGAQMGTSNGNVASQKFMSFFTGTPISSKQQIGNTLLKRRLSKFSSLVEGDTIEVTPTTWTVYGLGGEESDFDTFLADQNMINPGDTADISAVADVESLGFSVILPTTLPIYVDKLNQVSVATNATVENKSGAAVELQTIEIQAKPDTGWTLITNGEPSKKRDDKEFTFTTSLTNGTILDTGEIKPFSYNAKLSPLTEGVESLDLASVLVTVDWAPED